MSVTRTTKYKHMMVLLSIVGAVDKPDRISLVNTLLGTSITSFTQLTQNNVDDMVDMLSAWRTIQRHRFYSGTTWVEAEMLHHIAHNTDNGIIDYFDEPTEQSRKAFIRTMAKLNYDVSEEKYAVDMEKFDDDFDKIMHDIKDVSVSSLEAIEGRWPSWKLINSPTASLGLTLGIGGIPRGKIVHLWGKRHSGKSMLAHHFLAEAQKQGIPTVLIDAEAAATGDFVSHLGVDVDNLRVLRPRDLESLCTILRKLSETPALVVVDSIASSESSAELERNLIDGKAARVGGNARLWAQTLSIIRTSLLENGGTLILINQVRSKMEAQQWEEKEKPYGSEAIQHQMDISIKVSGVKEKNPTLKSQGYHVSRLRFDKNRFSGNTHTIDLPFKPGFPYNKSLDLVRICGEEIALGTGVSYGEAADNAIVTDKVWNDVDEKLISKKNRYTIKIDPAMMAAIRIDDEEFAEVDIEPLEDFDIDNIPPMDKENYAYFTIPNVGALRAAAWLKNHPTARDVLVERLLDGLNVKRELEMES